MGMCVPEVSLNECWNYSQQLALQVCRRKGHQASAETNVITLLFWIPVVLSHLTTPFIA